MGSIIDGAVEQDVPSDRFWFVPRGNRKGLPRVQGTLKFGDVRLGSLKRITRMRNDGVWQRGKVEETL